MANRAERRRRITDLYTVGEVLQVAPGQMVFVKKLNQFEEGEARADAMAARSRMVLAQRDDTNPEAKALRAAIGRMDTDNLIEGIVNSRFTRYMADANMSIHGDPEWSERMSIIDRTDRETATEQEIKVMDDINSSYLAELNERAKKAEADDRHELFGLDIEEVRHAYEEAIIETRATAVYIGEYKFGQLAWAIRMCDAEQPSEGQEWDHTACTHERLYVDEEIEEGSGKRVKRAVEFVREEPDALLDEYVSALDRVHVPVGQAKGSGSRQSSSAPSQPQNEEEELPASTQQETSSALAGTSA